MSYFSKFVFSVIKQWFNQTSTNYLYLSDSFFFLSGYSPIKMGYLTIQNRGASHPSSIPAYSLPDFSDKRTSHIHPPDRNL